MVRNGEREVLGVPMSERKIKRRKKLAEEKKAKGDMSKRVGLFLKVPNKCSSCDLRFDRKSKEMVRTWRVSVLEEEEIVVLHCPSCWESLMKDHDK